MKHLNYWALRKIAWGVGESLVLRLAEGRIPKIGADEIEAACDAEEPGLTFDDREMLIGLTCRRVVELTFQMESSR
jgi:hypothetical protein